MATGGVEQQLNVEQYSGVMELEQHSRVREQEQHSGVMDLEQHSGAMEVWEQEPCALQHYCGVFGVVAAGDWPTSLEVSKLLQLGLVGLQHRGQEGAGMVVGDGQNDLIYRKGNGLVHNIFSEDDLQKLRGNLGIGHTRYATMGGTDTVNIQPFIRETIHGKIALAHNGELINSKSLRKKVLMHGVGLSCGSDSELLAQLLTLPREFDDETDGPNWVARIEKIMTLTPTSYSLVIMHGDRIYAVRDPLGNRPLCIGKLMPPSLYKSVAGSVQLCEFEAYGWVVSSESCTFSSMGAKYYREVLPGEIVEISRHGIKSCSVVPRPEGKLPAFCIFEYVYFARPDSFFESQQVYTVRQNCGRQLALEAPVQADLVSTVPESANPAALEYAHTLNIPFQNVLTKNRYVGRTFIQPTSELRQLSVLQKFGPLVECYRGKKIVLIDDSIVRGTTMRSIVSLLKQSGAKEVHVRVASPPIHHPCYMGINIPTHDELIAPKMNVQEIAAHIMADSLQYLSVEGLQKAVSQGILESGAAPETSQGHCKACLTGSYPAALDW